MQAFEKRVVVVENFSPCGVAAGMFGDAAGSEVADHDFEVRAEVFGCVVEEGLVWGEGGEVGDECVGGGGCGGRRGRGGGGG